MSARSLCHSAYIGRIIGVLSGFGLALSPVSASAQSWIGDVLHNLQNNPTHYQLHGAFASDTDFGPALVFAYDRSPERTRAFGVTAGRKISDTVFGVPVQTFAYAGLHQFDERGLQPDAYGISAYVKFHKTFNLPWTSFPVRIGFGPGLNYVSRIPVAERRDFAPAESNKLLIYLEYSIQVSLAHLLGKSSLSSTVRDVYVGYTVIHRSSGYGLLAETGGGINYLGFGIEVAFR